MRWTCPKCGKKLDISNEQLIANDGVIVCPQCLLQAHQPPRRGCTAAHTASAGGLREHWSVCLAVGDLWLHVGPLYVTE